ncbi:MAG: phage tail protein [Acidobacteriota bacterium]|nr:phage tail protein [Acidobacteriota bacterium]
MARVDPYKNFNFRVEIGGITVAGFSECSGFGSQVDVIEYREGGDHIIRKLPGLARFGDITLKRGITKSRELEDWHRNTINGQPDRRSGSIILLDDDKSEVVRWNFFDAWIRKWEGPTLNAKGNEVAIETITLCCERMERAS